jgi:hypothetical protein
LKNLGPDIFWGIYGGDEFKDQYGDRWKKKKDA